MPTFVEHVEEYLGPIQAGARLSDGVQAAWFADCPAPGASTFMTFGLSHHVLHQTEGPDVRLELLIACDATKVQAFNPLSLLADVSDICAPKHHAPPRGTVIGRGGRFFPETEMAALYCSLPTCFHEGLWAFDGFPEPFLPIWLVPITADEARFVREQGWPAFEKLLDEADPDLLDLSRPSLLAGGA